MLATGMFGTAVVCDPVSTAGVVPAASTIAIAPFAPACRALSTFGQPALAPVATAIFPARKRGETIRGSVQRHVKTLVSRLDHLGVPVTFDVFGLTAQATGDLGIGVKHTLRHSLERGAILSVGGELVLPTGDEAKGFGKGTSVLESFVLYGKLLPRDSFIQVQAIVEWPNDSALEDELVARAAYGRTWTADAPFGRAWTPMIEVLAARELAGGAATQWDLVPQLQVSLNKRQHVLGAIGIRQPISDRGNRPTQLVFYLLWDWFDGGVLEGW